MDDTVNKLTVTQAFKAMFWFLAIYYQRGESEEIAGLLGDLQMLENGKPIDLGAWEDWERAVEKALSGASTFTIKKDLDQQ